MSQFCVVPNRNHPIFILDNNYCFSHTPKFKPTAPRPKEHVEYYLSEERVFSECKDNNCIEWGGAINCGCFVASLERGELNSILKTRIVK
jgi:hypothetical protein